MLKVVGNIRRRKANYTARRAEHNLKRIVPVVDDAFNFLDAFLIVRKIALDGILASIRTTHELPLFPEGLYPPEL